MLFGTLAKYLDYRYISRPIILVKTRYPIFLPWTNNETIVGFPNGPLAPTFSHCSIRLYTVGNVAGIFLSAGCFLKYADNVFPKTFLLSLFFLFCFVKRSSNRDQRYLLQLNTLIEKDNSRHFCILLTKQKRWRVVSQISMSEYV